MQTTEPSSSEFPALPSAACWERGDRRRAARRCTICFKKAFADARCVHVAMPASVECRYTRDVLKG